MGDAYKISPQALQSIIKAKKEKKPTRIVVMVTYFTYVQLAKSNLLQL